MSVSEPQSALATEAEDFLDVEGLCRSHGNWLLSFLRRRFAPQDAEDLAQDAYVRALDAQTQIRNPRAFLAQVAKRAAHDQARRSTANSVAVAEYAHREQLARPVHDTDALALKQAILALPPKVREVFLLSRFAGLTSGETVGSTAGERLPPAHRGTEAVQKSLA